MDGWMSEFNATSAKARAQQTLELTQKMRRSALMAQDETFFQLKSKDIPAKQGVEVEFLAQDEIAI